MAAPKRRAPAKTGAKTRRTTQRRRAPASPDILVLAPGDLQGLRARFEKVQAERATTQMLEESYQGFLQGLRERYPLPEFFNVDWSNGVITPIQIEADAAQAS